MWRLALVFYLAAAAAAEAGQARSSFQVGLVITGKATTATPRQAKVSTTAPLSRPRSSSGSSN